MSRIIGIDLGTANSCVAAMEGGKPVVVPNSEGTRTTSSVVAFTKIGERLVGESVKCQAVINADRTIASIKCHMGMDYKVTIDGKSYMPQEISAVILQKLKADAESYPGEKVSGVVITAPAHFNDVQCQAIKGAGKIADLKVRRIINESTVATLAYGPDNDKEQKIMVYDLGGGTFDVSITDIGEGVIEVLATSGDTHLDGDDLDSKITEWMIAEFKKQVGVDLGNDKMALQRLKEVAEKTKKELSTATTMEISPPLITVTAEDPQHFIVTLTRAKFDEPTVDLTERAVVPMQNVVRDAGITNTDSGKALLVGGPACMLNAQERVKQLTGMESSKALNLDECVTIGAAAQDGRLVGDSNASDMLLLDATPLSLSVETIGGIVTKLVEGNTTIPTRKSQVFSTAEDNQSAVDIHVMQGEREFARDNRSLSQFRLDDVLPAKRDVPQIEVTFDIDANGIVNVSAKDSGIGREQHIMITSGSNMSQEGTDKAVKEVSESEVQDKKKKKVIGERNDVGSLTFQTEEATQGVGEKLSGSDKAAVEADLSALKEAVNRAPAESMTDEQVADIKANKEKLMVSARQLFQKVYENAQWSQAGQGAADSGGSKPDDGIVDSDSKEV